MANVGGSYVVENGKSRLVHRTKERPAKGTTKPQKQAADTKAKPQTNSEG